MDSLSQHSELIAATEEEVAAWLSVSEGRPVAIHEVRRIEAQALRKLRRLLQARGLSASDLLPDR
jgi:hypothetical protein